MDLLFNTFLMNDINLYYDWIWN